VGWQWAMAVGWQWAGSGLAEIRNQKSDCDWNEPVYPGRYCSCTQS